LVLSNNLNPVNNAKKRVNKGTIAIVVEKDNDADL